MLTDLGGTNSLEGLFITLVQNGYEYIEATSKTWKYSFKYQNEYGVLFVLLRNHGVDLKFYPKSEVYGLDSWTEKNNIYSFQGGMTKRMSFVSSTHSVIRRSIAIARLHRENKCVLYIFDDSEESLH